MRISGTEPSSVILSHTKYFKKLKNDAQKLPKQTKAKRDGIINPQNYNFNQLYKYLDNCGPLPDFLLEIFMQNAAILGNSNV